MTRQPFDPGEVGSEEPALERVAERLDSYASSVDAEPPVGLTSRIVAAVDTDPEAPAARGGAWPVLAALRRPARAIAAAAVVVAAVTGALAFAQLVDRPPDIGASALPSPTTSATPSASPSPSPSPTFSPSPSPTPTATPRPTTSPTTGPTPVPTATDDDDDVETPEPTESDDDNSGPGGGDDDD